MLTSFCVGRYPDPDQALLDVLMLPELYMHKHMLLVSVQQRNGQLCTARVINDMCCASSTFSSHAAIKIFRLQHLLRRGKWSTTGSLFLFDLTQVEKVSALVFRCPLIL